MSNLKKLNDYRRCGPFSNIKEKDAKLVYHTLIEMELAHKLEEAKRRAPELSERQVKLSLIYAIQLAWAIPKRFWIVERKEDADEQGTD